MQSEIIASMTSIENTLMHKPRYNPYQTGHGVYKNKKHPSRGKRKKELRKQIEEEL